MMHASNFYLATDSPMDLPEEADPECRNTVSVLEELLGHSIRLRDLYKYGRLQTANIVFRHLFDNHYKEQLRVVDVLIDRIRMLGGTGRIFASDFLQSAQSSCVLRGRWSLMGLLRNLLDEHESVLGAARPEGRNERTWARDFAVGQVVLTNDLQAWTVGEQYAKQDPRQRFLDQI
jgi:hypothetical protein